MTDLTIRLERAMTNAHRCPIEVWWSFRDFVLKCARKDGKPLTKTMRDDFLDLLDRETRSDEATQNESDTLLQLLRDLESSADRHAARAALLDDVTLSSNLFRLADGIRQQIAALQAGSPRHAAHELQDQAQRYIARAITRLDRLERDLEGQQQ